MRSSARPLSCTLVALSPLLAASSGVAQELSLSFRDAFPALTAVPQDSPPPVEPMSANDDDLGDAMPLETPAARDAWTYDASFSLWLPQITGRAVATAVSTEVDIELADWFDGDVFTLGGRFEAQHGPWCFTGDVLAVGYEAQSTSPRFVRDDEVHHLSIELGAGYRIGEWGFGTAGGRVALEAMGGVRIASVNLDLRFDDVRPGGARARADEDEIWAEPFIGGRASIIFSRDWSVAVRGDIGGFEIGSDRTLSFEAGVRYRVSPRVTVNAGYRLLDVEYADGQRGDSFEYDVRMHGPMAGVTIRF